MGIKLQNNPHICTLWQQDFAERLEFFADKSAKPLVLCPLHSLLLFFIRSTLSGKGETGTQGVCACILHLFLLTTSLQLAQIASSCYSTLLQ